MFKSHRYSWNDEAGINLLPDSMVREAIACPFYTLADRGRLLKRLAVVRAKTLAEILKGDNESS